eukprot:1055340-Alexandrium_andersonii.AAC.1
MEGWRQRAESREARGPGEPEGVEAFVDLSNALPAPLAGVAPAQLQRARAALARGARSLDI